MFAHKFMLMSLAAVWCMDNKLIEDKLILSPAELIQLVVQEQKRSNAKAFHDFNELTTAYVHPLRVKETETTSEYNDEETLSSRKIWSRWGKWGDCSVTCGDGTITRRRMCVAGRCSPGECEEQRRHCTRSPCTHIDTININADELHDLD